MNYIVRPSRRPQAGGGAGGEEGLYANFRKSKDSGARYLFHGGDVRHLPCRRDRSRPLCRPRQRGGVFDHARRRGGVRLRRPGGVAGQVPRPVGARRSGGGGAVFLHEQRRDHAVQPDLAHPGEHRRRRRRGGNGLVHRRAPFAPQGGGLASYPRAGAGSYLRRRVGGLHGGGRQKDDRRALPLVCSR